MRYPKHGGYQHFLTGLAEEANIDYQVEVKQIDTVKRQVVSKDGDVYPYHRLVSS